MIKLLIVDDSVLFSELLKNRISEYEGIEVIGIAGNPYEARDKIIELEPDIMTLDIEMPRMDGLKFLEKLLPQYPLPVIMISSEAKSYEAKHAGAVSFRIKPAAGDSKGTERFVENVVSDILQYAGDKAGIKNKTPVKKANVGARKAEYDSLPMPQRPSANAAASKPAPTPPPAKIAHEEPAHRMTVGEHMQQGNVRVYSRNGIEIVALGASTGGTDALEKVIKGLPADCPPVVVTQHMPPMFTKMYAERLNRTTALTVYEGSDGLRLEKGVCAIAPGGKHMELMKDSKGYYVKCYEGEKMSGHCPSVDVLFLSVARTAGRNVVAALLTGMGADGAKGLLQLRKTGAYTIGQNKETCVVYGMPMEAYKMGAVCEEAALDDISGIIKRKMNY